MHRGDSKICRPTADRHSTCSVLNKTAPPVHGADGTQSIRTRLNPAKHYQAAKNQTHTRYKTLVGRVIAISRTPPWLASGWGCRGRRFLVQAQCCCARILFWHSFAVDSNSLNSVVSRSLTSNGSVLRAV